MHIEEKEKDTLKEGAMVEERDSSRGFFDDDDGSANLCSAVLLP